MAVTLSLARHVIRMFPIKRGKKLKKLQSSITGSNFYYDKFLCSLLNNFSKQA